MATHDVTNRTADISLRKAALIAGFGYAVIFLGGLGFFLISNLRVAGDAAATASSIMGSEAQFRIGIASVIVVLVADLIVAWALYIFLKPVSEGLSLLTAWVRLVYVAVAASAMVNLLAVLQLLSGADDLAAFQTGYE